MSFVSFSFVIFSPVVTTSYFLLPHRFRWVLLLAASCLFYMAFMPAYILVLFALIVVDYTAGFFLETAVGRARIRILLASITATVGVLIVFKYFNFLNANVASLATFFHWNYPVEMLALALPLGLSFHTFQSLSYVIEVYRGKYAVERHFGIYALYVMFYPQLVAGPIERPQHLLPQLHTEHSFDYTRVKLGLLRMAWGFFKKMVVADHLGLVVTQVYAQPALYGSVALIIATVFFTLQLYFDFSAYCDIALGAAQVMGFDLMENFNMPFAALSMAEFWRRWHISLSSWFRDYFYYPLVLSWKMNATRTGIYLATLITFLVTGFWHGANWTFGIFGALHGFYIVFGTITQKLRTRVSEIFGLSRMPSLHRALKVIVVFSLMAFSCIFFRAQSLSDAWYIVTHLANGLLHLPSPQTMTQSLFAIGISPKAFLLAIVLATFVFYCEYWGRATTMFKRLIEQPSYVRWSAYWLILFMIIAFSEPAASQFIYFQF